MSFSIVKSLLVALVAGSSVQALAIGHSSGFSASHSASSSFHSSGSFGSSINFGSASSFIQSHSSSSNLFSTYNVDINAFNNVFFQTVNSARSSQVIDLGSFSTLFGSNLSVCVPEIEKLIKEYLVQAGLKKTITFQVPTIKIQPSAQELSFAKYLSELKKKVTVIQDTRLATILAILNEPKMQFSSCGVCLNELNLIENNFVNFAQSSSSLSSFHSQSAGFLAAQQQSFSQSFSHSTSSSSGFSFSS